MRDVAERDRRVTAAVRVHGWKRPAETRCVRNNPVVIMIVLHELHVFRHLPGVFPVDPIRLEGARELRIVAGLRVVIALILIPAVNPHLVAEDTASGVHSEVVELVPVEPGVAGGTVTRQLDWLARQLLTHVVVRAGDVPVVRSRTRHHVEDGALHVAVLRRCAERNHLDLLDHVGIRPRPRASKSRRCEISPVEQPLVFIGSRPKRRDGGVVPARGRGRRDAWCALDEIEHAESAERCPLEQLGLDVRRDAGAARIDDRRGARDSHRLGHRPDLQRDIALDRSTDLDAEPLLLILAEP